MDATLNDGMLRVSRASFVPNVQATLSQDWGRRVAQQVVRASGLFGSSYMPWTAWTQAPQMFSSIYTYATNVQLPDGYFGSTIPPAIFVMPQYGSMVIYKSVLDTQKRLCERVMGGKQPTGNVGILQFTTNIEELKHDGTRWSFKIVHTVNDWSGGQGFKDAYSDMQYGFWPTVVAETALTNVTQLSGVTLHWVALGCDPNV